MTELANLTVEQQVQVAAHRATWIRIAKIHGWYELPFYITVWIQDGAVVDSVAHRGMTADVIYEAES